jgi:DNA-directed RNA polymerase specialized sigma24 family protein
MMAAETKLEPVEILLVEDNPVDVMITKKAFSAGKVYNKVDRLPDSLRTVIILADMVEFNHREIADLLGITVENAKVRLHRARKKLKELLEQKCTFENDERNVLVCEPKDTVNH